MSLASYSDLTTAISEWLARTGDSAISGRAGDFVTLSEDRIAYGSGDPEDQDATFYTRPLRLRIMETSTQILLPAYVSATVGGTANAITLTNASPIAGYALGQGYTFTATSTNTAQATVNIDGKGALNLVYGSAQYATIANQIVAGATYNLYDDGSGTHLILMPGKAHVPLPSNYLQMRNAFIDITPIRPLDILTPDQMDRDHPWQNTGTPEALTIEGEAIRFGDIPDKQYVVQCLYYQKFAALASASTNWLMTNKPSVYLWGSILEASLYLGKMDMAMQHLRLFRAAVAGLQAADQQDRYSGPLQIFSSVCPQEDG